MNKNKRQFFFYTHSLNFSPSRTDFKPYLYRTRCYPYLTILAFNLAYYRKRMHKSAWVFSCVYFALMPSIWIQNVCAYKQLLTVKLILLLGQIAIFLFNDFRRLKVFFIIYSIYKKSIKISLQNS